MGLMERRKGKRFERTCAEQLSQWIYRNANSLRPTPMSGGWSAMPLGDIQLSPVLKGEVKDFPFYVECRNRESWRLEQLFNSLGPIRAWWDETSAKAAEVKKCPLLIFTRNHCPSFAMFRMADVIKAVESLELPEEENLAKPVPMMTVPIAKIDNDIGQGVVVTEIVNVVLLDSFLEAFSFLQSGGFYDSGSPDA